MGGTSAERPISLATGTGIAASLRRLGHDVVSVDAAGGHVLPAGKEAEIAERAAAGGPLAPGATGALVEVPVVADADAVFIALHGGAGEDGTLQAVLDLARVSYTGSGMLASGLAMDKAMSKRLFEHAAIPTPNDQGSTVGLTIVRDAAALAGAFAEAARYSAGVLIESYVPGRELTVGVLGHEALPIVEIFPEHGVYDYACKYTTGKSRYEVPAQLEAGLASRIQELGLRAFQVLGCRGVARVDFRLDPEGRPYCLEVNTVPGMTPLSLVPMAAKARGLSYDDLVARALKLALEAAPARAGASPGTRTS
jgi:D-alanine-D-alanine ligase